VLTPAERSDLATHIPAKRISLRGMGVDFSYFHPLAKAGARKKLRLPLDKKIILYAGRFFESKAVDKVIRAFKALDDKNVLLVLIGGSKSDPLYKQAVEGASIVRDRVGYETLRLYYNAADAYVLYCNEHYTRYGGVGIAPLEALACGTPCVNSNLIYFPKAGRQFVGKAPSSEAQLAANLRYVLDHPKQFSRCREAAKKYYDWDVIVAKTLHHYAALFREYYGK
jgi:glycosyltransferase involved in cell wall biosynthesis